MQARKPPASENQSRRMSQSEKQVLIKQQLEERGPRTRLLPFAIRPAPRTNHHGEEVWLDPQQRAPQWLNLFYDLVIVAVLTVFSSNHEMSSSWSILVYFSYFVIIWWVWCSQVIYDVRFQANDWVHRFFKFLQLGTFIFVGVTSEDFDPSSILYPPSTDLAPGTSTESGAAE